MTSISMYVHRTKAVLVKVNSLPAGCYLSVYAIATDGSETEFCIFGEPEQLGLFQRVAKAINDVVADDEAAAKASAEAHDGLNEAILADAPETEPDF